MSYVSVGVKFGIAALDADCRASSAACLGRVPPSYPDSDKLWLTKK